MSTSEEAFERNLSHIRHELRSPLNAIIGYAEILIEEAEEGGQTDFIPDLEKIRASGRQLLERIGILLDVSQVEAVQIKPDTQESPESEVKAPDLDFSRIKLPDALFVRLEDAVVLHGVTEIRRCLNELQTLGGDAEHLADYLHRLNRRYDMETIKTTLKMIARQ